MLVSHYTKFLKFYVLWVNILTDINHASNMEFDVSNPHKNEQYTFLR